MAYELHDPGPLEFAYTGPDTGRNVLGDLLELEMKQMYRHPDKRKITFSQ